MTAAIPERFDNLELNAPQWRHFGFSGTEPAPVLIPVGRRR